MNVQTIEPTAENGERIAREIRPLAVAALEAQAKAKAERERVDEIQRRVLAGLGIDSTPDEVWELPDSVTSPYYAALNRIHDKAGFPGAREGRCPALVAETASREADRALLDAGLGLIAPGIDADMLLCLGMDEYKRAVKLLMGLALCAEG